MAYPRAKFDPWCRIFPAPIEQLFFARTVGKARKCKCDMLTVKTKQHTTVSSSRGRLILCRFRSKTSGKQTVALSLMDAVGLLLRSLVTSLPNRRRWKTAKISLWTSPCEGGCPPVVHLGPCTLCNGCCEGLSLWRLQKRRTRKARARRAGEGRNAGRSRYRPVGLMQIEMTPTMTRGATLLGAPAESLKWRWVGVPGGAKDSHGTGYLMEACWSHGINTTPRAERILGGFMTILGRPDQGLRSPIPTKNLLYNRQTK